MNRAPARRRLLLAALLLLATTLLARWLLAPAASGTLGGGGGTLSSPDLGAALSPVPPAQSTPQRTSGASVRVMPLGDSLTHGYTIPGGYRIELWAALAAAGLDVDFVGSQRHGPPDLADIDHEGHSGWRIDHLARSVDGWLQASAPDIILLMIGSNDMLLDYDVAGAPDRLGALLDQIATTLPDAHILVASIPPVGPGDDDQLQRIQAYNAALPAVVSARAAQGQRVRFVDIYGVIEPTDVDADGTHMNASGNAKMASAWYAALQALLVGDAHP
ncbi:MAG: SGNH/GDSL hydrolase family protein [Chloroflexota bacterium]